MTTAHEIEQALASFEANQVTVAAYMAACQPADPASREAVPRLAYALLQGRAPPTASVEAFQSLVDRWGSFIAHQALSGAFYSREGRYEEALREHLAALPDTPRWHPTSAYRVLDALGDDLLHLGRLDEAVLVAERALLIDPTNPFVLLTLGCAVAKAGNDRRAASIHAYLAARGYPMGTWGALLDALVVSPTDAEPFVPDLRHVAPVSDDVWMRFVAVNAHCPFTDLEEKIRAHATACLARGRYDYAWFASHHAPAWRSDRSPFEAVVVRAWELRARLRSRLCPRPRPSSRSWQVWARTHSPRPRSHARSPSTCGRAPGIGPPFSRRSTTPTGT